MLQPKSKFTPPSDAVVVETESSFVPPSDAVVLKKKESTESTSTIRKSSGDSVQTIGSSGTVGSNGFPAIDVNLGVPGLKPDFKTVDQLANPPKSKQETQPIKPVKERGFASELFYKLAKGSAELGAEIAATPELLYDVFSAPQNFIADQFNLPSLKTDSDKFKKTIGVRNAVKDFYKQEVQKLKEQSEQVDRKYQQGIYDSFKSGNYEDGFRQLTGSFAESLPASTSIMLGGAYAKAPQLLAASTMVFGAGKNEELKDENPEMSNNARVANALGTGLAEGVFETIGTGSIGSAAKAIVEREGAKKGFTILKDGLTDFYKEALKKNPLLASISGEGVEEWATQVTQNSIDVATGVKPSDFNVFDGATDAFISGAFGGAVFGGGLKGLEKISNSKDKSAIKSNFKKTFELQKALENPNVSEESKTEIHKVIDGLVKTNQKLIQKNVENVDNLDPKVKEKLVVADTKIDEIKNKVKAIKLDSNTTDSQKQILLDNLKEDFDKNVALKNDILDGKTTVVDVLPLKEQDKIKRQALKELTAELNPDGGKNIEIDNAQILERANKIYSKQNEKPQEVAVAEQVIEAQPQAEIETEIIEVEPLPVRFEKSLTLLKDIESKQGVDARNVKRERAEFLKQNPTIKYIDDNYRNITKQLEEQGLFKQLKDC